jgi:hypothetical protein
MLPNFQVVSTVFSSPEPSGVICQASSVVWDTITESHTMSEFDTKVCPFDLTSHFVATLKLSPSAAPGKCLSIGSSTRFPNTANYIGSPSVSVSTRFVLSGPFSRTPDASPIFTSDLNPAGAGKTTGPNFLLIGLVAAGVVLIVLAVVVLLVRLRHKHGTGYEMEEEQPEDPATTVVIDVDGAFLTQEQEISSELGIASEKASDDSPLE